MTTCLNRIDQQRRTPLMCQSPGSTKVPSKGHATKALLDNFRSLPRLYLDDIVVKTDLTELSILNTQWFQPKIVN